MRASQRGARARGKLGLAATLAVGVILSGESLAGQTAPPPAARAEASGDTLSLERAVAAALEGNPEVRVAAARATEAAAAGRAAWGALLPSVGANAAFSRADFRTVTFPAPEGSSERLEEPLESIRKGSNLGLLLRWDLLRGGSRITGLRESAATERAASLRLAAAERRTAAAVRRAYYEALATERLAELAGRQLEERRRDLEVARRRYELAAVDRSDVLGAEIEVGTAELALLEARDAAEAARRALSVAMGTDPEESRALALREPASPSPDAADALDVGALVARALASEPEFAALEADAEAASAGRWSALARYLPDLSLSFGLQRSESLGPDGRFFVLDPSNRTTSLALSASWNLFDGFRREWETAAAGARHQVARAERASRALVLEREVRDLADEVRSRARRLRLRERTADLAERRLEMARERYRLGGIDYVELLSAADRRTQAERALIRERYHLLSAWASLEERAGDVF